MNNNQPTNRGHMQLNRQTIKQQLESAIQSICGLHVKQVFEASGADTYAIEAWWYLDRNDASDDDYALINLERAMAINPAYAPLHKMLFDWMYSDEDSEQ